MCFEHEACGKPTGSRPMSNNKLLLNFCVKSAKTLRVVVAILRTRLKWISPITEYYSQSAVPVVMGCNFVMRTSSNNLQIFRRGYFDLDFRYQISVSKFCQKELHASAITELNYKREHWANNVDCSKA